MLEFLNKSLWIDEGYSNITSFIISQKGIPLYDSGHWDGSYLFFHYLQAGVFKIFGYSPEISRILPAILGVISLIFVYKISKILFENKIIALLSVFITFFSYYYIFAITQARYYSLMILLFSVGIYYILKFFKNPSVKLLFITLNIIFFSIIYHVYLYSLLPVLFLAIVFIIYDDKENFRKNLKNYIKIGFFIIINFIIFYSIMKSINPGQATGSIIKTISLVNYDYTGSYIKFFIDGFGFLFFLMFLGLFYPLFSKNFTDKYIVLIAFFFPFFVISKLVFMFATRYVYFLMPLLIIFGVGFIYLIYTEIKVKYLKILYIIILGILYFFFPIKLYFNFASPIYSNDPYSPEPDFKRAYEIIKQENLIEKSNIISVFPHMDYLYLGKSDYYIYVDETGIGIKPEENFYVKNNKNIFTNAEIILKVEDLEKLNNGKTNYIILDQLGLVRLKDSEILKFIENNYKMIFEKVDNYNVIRVYKYE